MEIQNLNPTWIEVYTSKQRKTPLKWTVTAVEEHKLGEEKILCLIVEKDNIKGLIPLEFSGIKPAQNKGLTKARMMTYLGQEIEFIITEINLEDEMFIATRKPIIEKQEKEFWESIKEGDIIEVIIRRVYHSRKDDDIRQAGFIVDKDGIEGYLPIRELAHGYVEDITSILQPGDKTKVKVLWVNKEEKKYAVSRKALIEDPWPTLAGKIVKNGTYLGRVTGVMPYGVFVEIKPGVYALCSHMRFGYPEKGDQVYASCTKVDLEKRKINGKLIRIARKKS